MDHLISSAGLRLRYLCGPNSTQQLDVQQIVDDLSEPETRYALYCWFATTSLSNFDHVVLASDCETGRHVALLVANDGATASEAYLDLQAAFVIDAMHGSMLLRRMLAFTISRIGVLGTAPRIIAARTSIATCYRMLSLFAQIIPEARVFPDTDPAVVDLCGAGLARRIARRIAPNCNYEAATGAIKGAKLTTATCFARTAAIPEQAVKAMFERNLDSGDQMLVVVDMRRSDEATITAKTTKLVRKRWQIPVVAVRRAASSRAARIQHEKPTLTA